MKLIEYMGGKASLTDFEGVVFGIGILSKGWKKRSAEIDVTEEMLKKVCEWFEPHSFTIEDVESLIPCKKVKVFDGVKKVKDGKEVKSAADTEEYQYLHIKHETPKALLFNILGHDIWVAKSCIKTLNKNRHLVKVRIGYISDKLKCVQ